MIILHKAQRTDGKGEVKGFITKMWGEYHIILENNENTAYPVLEETISPCFPIERVIHLNMNSASYFNPFDFDMTNITKEQIKNKIQEIVEFNKLLNKYSELKDILEQVCLTNDLVLSDKDKEEILNP